MKTITIKLTNNQALHLDRLLHNDISEITKELGMDLDMLNSDQRRELRHQYAEVAAILEQLHAKAREGFIGW